MFKIKKNYNIKNFSTFKIGGRVKYFCDVKNEKEFLEAVKSAKKLRAEIKVIGGGSNILFPDEDLNCFLIRFCGGKLEIKGNKIIVGAGVKLLDLVQKAVENGLAGAEKLAGIPGTIGGAVAGNAGAFGHSISEVVERVRVFDGQKIGWFSDRQCGFGYRESIFSAKGGSASGGKKKPYIVLRVILKLKPFDKTQGKQGNKKELKRISDAIIKIRNEKYPRGIKCAGSFFKNILIKDAPKKVLKLIPKNKIIADKISAGYLLESIGAKGMAVGDARVADFHANFLINTGHAKAKDIKKLAEILKKKVKQKFGIVLKEEVRYF